MQNYSHDTLLCSENRLYLGGSGDSKINTSWDKICDKHNVYLGKQTCRPCHKNLNQTKLYGEKRREGFNTPIYTVTDCTLHDTLYVINLQ